MREPYEAPAITLLGSVTDLTQANILGGGTDGLSFFGIPLGGSFGDDTFS